MERRTESEEAMVAEMDRDWEAYLADNAEYLANLPDDDARNSSGRRGGYDAGDDPTGGM